MEEKGGKEIMKKLSKGRCFSSAFIQKRSFWETVMPPARLQLRLGPGH